MIFQATPGYAGLAGPPRTAEPASARGCGNAAIVDAEGCQAESFLSARGAAIDVAPRVNDSFVCEYDFGDGWEHLVLVEKILTREEGAGDLPVCLAGVRACPPEDCGGVPGYESFLQAIGDPTHEEHGAMLAWVGGKFDPEAFDLRKVNRHLRRLKRV